ncbi:MAG: DUF4238 domain-containing protein [Saprospiraceae bacterium]|nr:DUF4238 domain-containing protein [Saprospiraceae bacterium]
MNQHYVPRVYLKNFATKKKDEFYVNVYDKQSSNNFTTNIKNICSENNLYTLNKNDHFNPLIIEEAYAKYFEPLYETAYKLLVDDNIIEISDEERAIILVAIFQFYFRNTKILNESISFHRKRIELLFYKNKLAGQAVYKYIDHDFDTNKDLEQQQIQFENESKYSFKKEHIDNYTELALKNSWQSISIYKICDESKFITCDDPLKNLNLEKNSKNPFQISSQFFLPLNEKYCLFLHNDRTKTYNKVYREDVYNGRAFMINSNSIENSQRFAIGDQSAINDTLRLENLINTEYENNIDKLMELVAQSYPILKAQGASKEHLEVNKKYLDLYKCQGTLTDTQKKDFLREAIDQQKQYWIKKL